MKTTLASIFGRSVLALTLGTVALLTPVGAMAQRGGGGHASGGGGARSFAGGGTRGFSGGGYSGGRAYVSPRGYTSGPAYAGRGYGGFNRGYYRGGLYLGFGGYGGYPYGGYAYAPGYSYYGDPYYGQSYPYNPGYYSAPVPQPCPPAYDRYGNPIPNTGCYNGQAPYQQQYTQPQQQYAPTQPYGGR